MRLPTEPDTLALGRELGGRLTAGDLVLLTGPLGAATERGASGIKL